MKINFETIPYIFLKKYLNKIAKDGCHHDLTFLTAVSRDGTCKPLKIKSGFLDFSFLNSQFYIQKKEACFTRTTLKITVPKAGLALVLITNL